MPRWQCLVLNGSRRAVPVTGGVRRASIWPLMVRWRVFRTPAGTEKREALATDSTWCFPRALLERDRGLLPGTNVWMMSRGGRTERGDRRGSGGNNQENPLGKTLFKNKEHYTEIAQKQAVLREKRWLDFQGEQLHGCTLPLPRTWAVKPKTPTELLQEKVRSERSSGHTESMPWFQRLRNLTPESLSRASYTTGPWGLIFQIPS